ncbi:MAG TPA: hypothetical protein VKE40_11590 [Gemmataceae bacterium]|nr:hypothetical protein [Gemmataceae bacterium]
MSSKAEPYSSHNIFLSFVSQRSVRARIDMVAKKIARAELASCSSSSPALVLGNLAISEGIQDDEPPLRSASAQAPGNAEDPRDYQGRGRRDQKPFVRHGYLNRATIPAPVNFVIQLFGPIPIRRKRSSAGLGP